MTVAATAKRRRRQLKLTNKSKRWSTNASKRYAEAKQSLVSRGNKKK